MPNELFTSIDRYIEDLCVPRDEALAAALRDSDAAGLPRISITANQGQLLCLLAKIAGARRILEIGLLGGYSTIFLARALPENGRLVTLELEEKHAAVAKTNLERAGVLPKVEIRVGPALDLMSNMVKSRVPPFDFIFIDADKVNYPGYLNWSLKLSQAGTVIVADNVIRNGKVLDSSGGDADLVAVRAFNQQLAAHPRLETILLPCIKGELDGLAIARVRDA